MRSLRNLLLPFISQLATDALGQRRRDSDLTGGVGDGDAPDVAADTEADGPGADCAAGAV